MRDLGPHWDWVEEVVVQDYFTYRIYNLLSDMSFRVRLGRATYVNTAEAAKPPKRKLGTVPPSDCKEASFSEIHSPFFG